MTEVRLRGESGEAYPIGDIPLTRKATDEAIALVKAWGLQVDDCLVDSDSLFGQFAIRDGSAFFEIVEDGSYT